MIGSRIWRRAIIPSQHFSKIDSDYYPSRSPIIVNSILRPCHRIVKNDIIFAVIQLKLLAAGCEPRTVTDPQCSDPVVTARVPPRGGGG
jgi:hypothetical protein